MFHVSLQDIFKAQTNRQAKSNDLDDSRNTEKLSLGNFTVDPIYTEFVGKLQLIFQFP